jgi:WD40 repeat protein
MGDAIWVARDNALVQAIAISSDGKLLAAGGDFGEVCVWNLRSNRMVHCFPSGVVGALAFSPNNGTLIVAAPYRRVVQCWDINRGALIRTLEGHKQHINSAIFSPDGKRILSCGDDGLIIVWDAESGKKLTQLSESRESISSLAISPDGRVLATGGKEGTITIWNLKTSKQLCRWQGDEVGVRCIAFSPDGRKLGSGGFGPGLVSLWDTQTYQQIRQYSTIAGCGAAIVFSPDGKSLACAGPLIRLWSSESGKDLSPPLLHEASVKCMAFHPEGQLLATGSDDKTIRLWKIQCGEAICCLKGHRGGLRCLAFSPDGKLLASAASDRSIRLWESKSGRGVCELAILSGLPLSLSFSPSGDYLGAAEHGGLITIWDIRFRKLITRIQVHRDTNESVDFSFSFDGHAVITRGLRELSLWNATSGKKIVDLAVDLNLSSSVSASLDHLILYTSGVGDEIVGWNLKTSRTIYRCSVPESYHSHLTASPDGRLVASPDGSTPGSISVWEGLSATKVGTFGGGTLGASTVLTFSPDGRTLASASEDTTVFIWDITGFSSGESKHVTFSTELLNSLWDDLGTSNHTVVTHSSDNCISQSQRALWTFVSGGDQTLRFLRRKLRPVPPVEKQILTRLVGDLDHDSFPIRNRATERLAALGEIAESALRDKLNKQPTPEYRERATALLHNLQPPISSPEALKASRSIQILEQMNTTAARRLLQILADGATDARITQEAQAALQRLSRRSPIP